MKYPRYLGTILIITLFAGFTTLSTAQQEADITFIPDVDNPTFLVGNGPLIVIDEAHNNFHTLDGRYQAFARLLKADGYRVEANARKFTAGSLSGVDILVIANAIADQNVDNWDMPNPTAFTDQEVEVVREWVGQGGSLWLIADHMPCPASAANLAAAFGVLFINGYAIDPEDDGGMVFRPDEGTLRDHPIVQGRTLEEKVGWVTSFTGQGFRVIPGADIEPIMVLGDNVEILLPEKSWQFTETTQTMSGAGLLQGAVLRYRQGRVAAFGEAAMFTSQIGGDGEPAFGMAHQTAPHNPRFVLNIAHWLSGLLNDTP